MKPLKPKLGYYARRQAQKAGVSTFPLTNTGPCGETVLKKDKGEKGGSCNRIHCQKPASEDCDGIRWFNHSTRKYYCFRCALELNEDRFNKADSQRIWRHNLCTLEAA